MYTVVTSLRTIFVFVDVYYIHFVSLMQHYTELMNKALIHILYSVTFYLIRLILLFSL